jgi:type II secretory pathway pseudopilin PulG
MRRGVTLIELLVATGIFVTGFTAIAALFTAGTKLRAEADTLVRCSLAAESLIEDIRLDAKGGKPPSAWLGDGFTTSPDATPDRLYPYTAAPGTWYMVETATDAAGNSGNPQASTLHLGILVLHKPLTGSTVTLEELRTRILRWRVPAGATDADAWTRDELVARGIALRMDAVVVPQPSWR